MALERNQRSWTGGRGLAADGMGYGVYARSDSWGQPGDPPPEGMNPHPRPGEHADPPSGRRSYAGLGPKGWSRDDARVHDDVCDALMLDPFVDASDIEVTVQAGEVTLSGTVADRQQKRAAASCADHVPGVRDVHNHLRVSAS